MNDQEQLDIEDLYQSARFQYDTHPGIVADWFDEQDLKAEAEFLRRASPGWRTQHEKESILYFIEKDIRDRREPARWSEGTDLDDIDLGEELVGVCCEVCNVRQAVKIKNTYYNRSNTCIYQLCDECFDLLVSRLNEEIYDNEEKEKENE